MNLPWFIFDINNMQLITSQTIPDGDISDSKDIIFTETPILGNNFSPISNGSNGNRKISMKLPLLHIGASGNVALVKQFDILRNKSQGLLGLRKQNFNPKVLYYWGTGSVPLEYFVTKCNIAHDARMVNALGVPQHSVIELELVLDETSPLYKAEEIYRNVVSVLGTGIGIYEGTK